MRSHKTSNVTVEAPCCCPVSATQEYVEKKAEKEWRIGYVDGYEMGHVSTEYCTIGSQPGMDGSWCVRCDCVCTVWTDNGDSVYAVVVLVVVEVNEVMSGVIGVCDIRVIKARRVVTMLMMSAVSKVWRSALKLVSTWCVR